MTLPARRPKERKASKPKKVRRVCLPYRKWLINEWACAGCGVFGTVYDPLEAAHYRIGTNGGMGLKPSDRWLLPLCYKCHHCEQHQKGERSFWRGQDPKAMAEALARVSPYWPILREMP